MAKDLKNDKLDPEFVTPERLELIEAVAATTPPIRVDTKRAL